MVKDGTKKTVTPYLASILVYQIIVWLLFFILKINRMNTPMNKCFIYRIALVTCETEILKLLIDFFKINKSCAYEI